MKRRPTSILTTLALSVLPPEKGAPPTLKRTDKTQKPLYMTAAMGMMVLLAVTVLLAQDNTEAVILTEEEFQAVLAAGGSIPVGTILTDEQFERYAASINGGEDAEQGDAVEQDILANTQGDAETQFSIGRMYATSEGLLKGKDEAQAVRWYRRAADQGYAAAQYHLGIMYAAGRGLLKDSVLAHMWWNIASANGHETAREVRDDLERDMTRAEISRATELAQACMAADYQDCEP